MGEREGRGEEREGGGWERRSEHTIKSEQSSFLHSGRSILVKDLRHPFGLALFNEYLYWTDQVGGTVQRVNKTSGANRTLLVNELDFVLDITVFVRNRTQPGKVSPHTTSSPEWEVGGEEHLIKESLYFIYILLSAVHPCYVNNGGCSHLCLVRPNPARPGGLEVSCACPTGLKVMADGRTCFSGTK